MNFLYLFTDVKVTAEEHLIIMQSNSCITMGRTELAQRYFPYIQPQSAWQKLRSLLADDPDLEPLATLRRRTFLPAEVAKIYEILGHP